MVNCRSRFVGEHLIDCLLAIHVLTDNDESMEAVISLEKEVDGVNPFGSAP
jgi:hypothetical protein